ncbi:MAG: tetratricopeptide repeat protein [Gemmatimonadetes bacterium]|nr:tetratricopeptide repeat protein [Gemmatimonadota bacterium]
MEQVHKDRIERGRRSFERRDYASALADFRDVLAEHPGYADLRHLCGLCHSFMGQPEEALEEFDRALSLNDHYVEAHLNRALTLNELGRYDEAAESFERAGYYEYAVAGRFPSAIMARLAQTHARVGDLYQEAGAPLEAAAQYRRALELRPRFHDIRNKLAQTLLQIGDLNGAADQLRITLHGNPRFVPARLNYGLALFRLGDAAGARREWEECHEIEPNNPQVSAYLALLDQKET